MGTLYLHKASPWENGYVENGASAYDLMRVMGCASIQVAQRYVDASGQARAEATGKL